MGYGRFTPCGMKKPLPERPEEKTIDLFQVKGTKLSPLDRVPAKLEREIQRLLEANLETVFGIHLLASEYATGQKHAGRIDTLGLDENHTPVIIEYKLSSSVSVVMQALFYLDWLLDHKGDVEILARKRLGSEVPVDWTQARIMCVAEKFAPYDLSAISHLGRSAQLVEYKLFTGGLLLIDILGGAGGGSARGGATSPTQVASYSIDAHLGRARGPLREIADELRAYLLALGDDVSEGPTREYIAFRTTRNLCCLEIHQEHILLHLTLDPRLGEGCALCTDVTNIGHFGTGNLRVRVSGPEDVPIAKGFIEQAYKQLSQ
jgi:predicted transport protein